MKKEIISKLLWIYLGLLIAGLIAVFNPDGKIKEMGWIDGVCLILGVVGFVYCLGQIIRWIFFPISRDWMLVRGKFLLQVVCFVLSVPFTITAGIMVANCNDNSSVKKEIILGPNMYIPENDTLKVNAPLEHLSVHTQIGGYEQCENEEGIYIKQIDKAPAPVDSVHKELHLFWSVYYHFIDPGNQHMATSRKGRGIAAIAALLGIVLLNGLLITTLINYFDRRKEQWLNGEIRYKARHLGKNRFAIVIGANEIAASVIKNLFTKKTKGEINFKCEGDNRYIILQTSRDAQTVREELSSHLDEEQLNRVIIYKALRDSDKEISLLHLEYTTEIYVLGESTLNDGGETYHDAMNMRCVNLIANQLNKSLEKRKAQKEKTKKSIRRVCKVMFEYQTTYSIFQFSDISENVKNNLVFIPFNRYESWARKVMVDNEALSHCSPESIIRYTPLDGHSGIKAEDNSYVHFIIVGMSKMGIAMGVQAMLQAHYLNYNKRKSRITFIDTNADKEMAFFKGRYSNLFELTRYRYMNCEKDSAPEDKYDWNKSWNDPFEAESSKWKHLSDENKNFIDIEIEFIKGRIESDGVREFLCQAVESEDAKVTIAICLTQTHQAIAASLYLPIDVYKSNNLQEIWIYQRESADIIANFHHKDNKDLRYQKIRPFGMLYGEYMSDRTLYIKALLVNGAYNLNGKEYTIDKRDMSNKNTYTDLREIWKILSIDKKFSNKYFVDSIPQKIRAIHNGDTPCDLTTALNKNKDILAICEHNRWNVQQLILGYSPCNATADEEFKELNKICNTSEAKEARKKWREEIGWNKMSPLQQILANESPEYLSLPHGKFNEKKRLYKEGEDRIHPNICDFSHLNDIDYQAIDYDIYINNAIPQILQLINKK